MGLLCLPKDENLSVPMRKRTHEKTCPPLPPSSTTTADDPSATCSLPIVKRTASNSTQSCSTGSSRSSACIAFSHCSNAHENVHEKRQRIVNQVSTNRPEIASEYELGDDDIEEMSADDHYRLFLARGGKTKKTVRENSGVGVVAYSL